MFTTSFRNTVLGTVGGFLGLIKSITDFRAGTVAEADYTGYGTRPAVSWGATADTSPAGARQISNGSDVVFPANTGSNQDAIAWGVYSASTGGVLQTIGFLDTDSPVVGTANADDTIDAYGHGLEADQRVFVLPIPGLALPTGISENTAYFVLASGLTTDVFKISTTSGGAAVNITAGGAALFMPYKARTIATGATPRLAAGQVVVQL